MDKINSIEDKRLHRKDWATRTTLKQWMNSCYLLNKRRPSCFILWNEMNIIWYDTQNTGAPEW